MKSCIISILQPVVAVNKALKSLIYSEFLAYVQCNAITTAKQLAMPVIALAIVGNLIAVADGETVLSAVPPDRTLHEPRKRLGEGGRAHAGEVRQYDEVRRHSFYSRLTRRFVSGRGRTYGPSLIF
jgi:hypothetical protein